MSLRVKSGVPFESVNCLFPGNLAIAADYNRENLFPDCRDTLLNRIERSVSVVILGPVHGIKEHPVWESPGMNSFTKASRKPRGKLDPVHDRPGDGPGPARR